MKITTGALSRTGALATALALLCIGVALIPQATAQPLSAHQHGQALLNVVRMERSLQLEFISPAINLLGFESAPATAEQRARLVAVADLLRDGRWLLGDALDDCAMRLNALEPPQFDSADSGSGHGEHGHVDYRVEYLYECPDTPAAELSITAFAHFPGIERIRVQWLAGRSQGLSELSTGNPQLRMP